MKHYLPAVFPDQIVQKVLYNSSRIFSDSEETHGGGHENTFLT